MDLKKFFGNFSRILLGTQPLESEKKKFRFTVYHCSLLITEQNLLINISSG